MNKSQKEAQDITVNMLDFDGYKPFEFISMDGYDKKAENYFDSEKVKPHKNELPSVDSGEMNVHIAPFSWNVIRLKKFF